jgi:ribonuclease E
MTEVPEKETEGAPRRRRGGRTRDDRPETPAASAAGRTGNLIMLPGERLSRGPAGEELAATAETVDAADLDETLDVADGEATEYAGSENGAAADANRRRRRRGGRGRGRGRGRDSEELVATGASYPAAEPDEEDEDFEELPPAQPAVQAFGSVWDSQIGVPSGTPAASAGSFSMAGEDEEDLDEPEVPEYLLAERRQRGRQGGNRAGGGRQARGRSAYQAALDRERFGNRAPQPSFGGSNTSQGNRSDRPDRGRDRGRGGRPQQGNRPYDRTPRPEARPYSSEPRSAEPWSEVPPELEEMLRAELARKSPAPEASTPSMTGQPESPAAVYSATPDDEPETPAAKPARRTRTTKSSASAATEAATDAGADAAAEEKPKRKTATRATKSTSTRSKSTKAAASDGADSADAAGTAGVSEEAPKKTTRRRTTKAAAEAPAEES